jgi:hypothetical protein
MPDFLVGSITEPITTLNPGLVLLRLCLALALGGAVSWIYSKTTHHAELAGSLPITLVLLSVLIAMVTQVVGDNVARAFSLVGALSIVRFRTVVRDTRDTAFVIFAVIVGMAVGAQSLWVAVIGLLVTGGAAFFLARNNGKRPEPVFLLKIRAETADNLGALVKDVVGAEWTGEQPLSVQTVKQTGALEATFEVKLGAGMSPEAIVRELTKREGVLEVKILNREMDKDSGR